MVCLSCAPNWGPGPQPSHVPRLGIKPATLWCTGQHSIYWATPAREGIACLKILVTHQLKTAGHRIVLVNIVVKSLSLRLYLFTFREGKKTLMWERNRNQLLLTGTRLGTEPATQACALMGKSTGNLSFSRMTPSQLSHKGQGALPSYLLSW